MIIPNYQGVYTWTDKRKYVGDFVDNFMHGKGVYIWGDGRKYEGEYKNDKKHGFGKYVWVDGRAYIGLWVNGKQDGYGKYILTDKSASIGLWNKGKKVKWINEQELEKLKKDKTFIKIFIAEVQKYQENYKIKMYLCFP